MAKEIFVAYGIDVDAVMQATMRTSRYRWASSLASRMR